MSLWTNERPGSKTRDHSRPMRGHFLSQVVTLVWTNERVVLYLALMRVWASALVAHAPSGLGWCLPVKLLRPWRKFGSPDHLWRKVLGAAEDTLMMMMMTNIITMIMMTPCTPPFAWRLDTRAGPSCSTPPRAETGHSGDPHHSVNPDKVGLGQR